MTTSRMNRFALAAAMIGLGTLTIAGCASGPQPQTEAEACNVVSAGMSGVSDEISAAFTDVGSGDAAAAQEVFTKLDATMAKVDQKLEQPKVKAAFGDIRDAIAGLSAALDPLLGDGAMSDTTMVAEATAAFEAANTTLVDSGAAMNDLCGS